MTERARPNADAEPGTNPEGRTNRTPAGQPFGPILASQVEEDTPPRCTGCGVMRPRIKGLVLDFDEAGLLIGIAPLCTFCWSKSQQGARHG